MQTYLIHDKNWAEFSTLAVDVWAGYKTLTLGFWVECSATVLLIFVIPLIQCQWQDLNPQASQALSFKQLAPSECCVWVWWENSHYKENEMSQVFDNDKQSYTTSLIVSSFFLSNSEEKFDIVVHITLCYSLSWVLNSYLTGIKIVARWQNLDLISLKLLTLTVTCDLHYKTYFVSHLSNDV